MLQYKMAAGAIFKQSSIITWRLHDVKSCVRYLLLLILISPIHFYSQFVKLQGYTL